MLCDGAAGERWQGQHRGGVGILRAGPGGR